MEIKKVDLKEYINLNLIQLFNIFEKFRLNTPQKL